VASGGTDTGGTSPSGGTVASGGTGTGGTSSSGGTTADGGGDSDAAVDASVDDSGVDGPGSSAVSPSVSASGECYGSVCELQVPRCDGLDTRVMKPHPTTSATDYVAAGPRCDTPYHYANWLADRTRTTAAARLRQL